MTAFSSNPPHANAIAIIGAGPSGLVTARWLIAQGFEPVLFEASEQLGGQWNGQSALSATWPGMRTNTSRLMTSFADLDHDAGVPVYPRREDVLAYLQRYAAQFDLSRRIRVCTDVVSLQRAEDGYLLTSSCRGRIQTEKFGRVVVASGRYISPTLPDMDLEGFTGAFGATHSAQYQGAAVHRDQAVLVAGCSISALEIASDLAMSGAKRVTSTYRRQRYVLPKLLAGVPTDHVMFTRSAALAAGQLPGSALAEGLKARIVSLAGTPDQFGAMAPHENVLAAGISQSQHFLPLVAEGRIITRPWIERIEGRTVHFQDGSAGEFDAILFGTGYRLSLPYLAPDIAEALGLDETRIALCDHTFHPDLEGLGFVGLYDLVGPAFPVLELQARWLAYAWAGRVPIPSQQALREGVARCQAKWSEPQTAAMQDLAVLFARNATVEPDVRRWPDLERALLFGPLSPISFRLEGPDSLPDAPARTAEAAAEFGAIRSGEMSLEERELRQLLLAPSSKAA